MPLVAGLSLALAVLAGCAGDDTVDQAPNAGASTPPTAAARTVLPSQLVGQWDVEGAGVQPGTVLTFTASEVRVFLDCGLLDGSWRAMVGGAFLADLYGASGGCDPKGDTFTPTWLGRAAHFVVDGDRRELRTADEQVVASLRPARKRPNVPSTVIDSYGDPPVVTEQERAELDRVPPAFPDGIRPAEVSELLGTWVLPGETGGEGNWPHATFREDGVVDGSDGCNGSRERYVLVEGALLMSEGVSTLIGCENIDITAGAVLAGFDGDTLVLIGEDGQETRRAVRGPAPKLAKS